MWVIMATVAEEWILSHPAVMWVIKVTRGEWGLNRLRSRSCRWLTAGVKSHHLCSAMVVHNGRRWPLSLLSQTIFSMFTSVMTHIFFHSSVTVLIVGQKPSGPPSGQPHSGLNTSISSIASWMSLQFKHSRLVTYQKLKLWLDRCVERN